MKSSSFVLLGCVLIACLHVSEERAERDMEVGRAERDGLRVTVEGGLAAVRRLEPGRLELWANAPSLRVRLELPASAPEAWVLRVRNALPDAVLTVRDAAGNVVPSDELASEIPTDRSFALSLQQNSELTLQLSPPDLEQPEPFEFLEFGDVQDAIDSVQDIFRKMNAERGARFAVMAGDITESGSADECERFQREQRSLRIPIFVTLGNHELGDGDIAYYDYFGRGSESFTFHTARFTLLDTASATLDPRVYGWLDGWLEQGRQGAHFLFMHIPPIEPIGVRNGAFASRAEANKLLARLGRARVSATFYGHIHSYYEFDNAGIPAFISGGGGAIPERFDGMGRHFLVVRVDPAGPSFTTRIVRVD